MEIYNVQDKNMPLSVEEYLNSEATLMVSTQGKLRDTGFCKPKLSSFNTQVTLNKILDPISGNTY